jgi:hypothetical protein
MLGEGEVEIVVKVKGRGGVEEGGWIKRGRFGDIKGGD